MESLGPGSDSELSGVFIRRNGTVEWNGIEWNDHAHAYNSRIATVTVHVVLDA